LSKSFLTPPPPPSGFLRPPILPPRPLHVGFSFASSDVGAAVKVFFFIIGFLNGDFLAGSSAFFSLFFPDAFLLPLAAGASSYFSSSRSVSSSSSSDPGFMLASSSSSFFAVVTIFLLGFLPSSRSYFPLMLSRNSRGETDVAVFFGISPREILCFAVLTR
jgi:hypothetical protein